MPSVGMWSFFFLRRVDLHPYSSFSYSFFIGSSTHLPIFPKISDSARVGRKKKDGSHKFKGGGDVFQELHFPIFILVHLFPNKSSLRQVTTLLLMYPVHMNATR